MAERRQRGQIELQVAKLVTELQDGGDPPAGLGVYAVQARKLAATLDTASPEFLAIAAVSRELRELVKAMTTKEGPGDGDPRTGDLLARLSAPLGHSAN